MVSMKRLAVFFGLHAIIAASEQCRADEEIKRPQTSRIVGQLHGRVTRTAKF